MVLLLSSLLVPVTANSQATKDNLSPLPKTAIVVLTKALQPVKQPAMPDMTANYQKYLHNKQTCLAQGGTFNGTCVVPTPVPTPTPVAAVAYATPAPVVTHVVAASSLGGAWALLRQCEAGGNYSENTGNGYYGAYQYDISTWAKYGGYARPDLAPPAVQDAKAQETYAARGSAPWPVCGRKAGL